MENESDKQQIISYIVERAIAEQSIPQYLMQEYDGKMDINKFISDIYYSHDEFLQMSEDLMCYSNDDEHDYIVDKTNYSREMIELALWFEECYLMKMDYITYFGKCKICGNDELYIREDEELYTSYIQCGKCNEKYTFEDIEDSFDDDIFKQTDAMQTPCKGKITDKSYVFKAATGYKKGIWRKIQISSGATLDELSSAILDAFEFDDDHLYAFYMDEKGRRRNVPVYHDPRCRDEPRADRIMLDQLGFKIKTKFLFLYDFGDEWQFTITFDKEVEDTTQEPFVIDARGEAPEQYPS